MDWKSNSTPKKPKKNLCSTSGTKVMLTLVFGTETLSANKFLATEILSVNKHFIQEAVDKDRPKEAILGTDRAAGDPEDLTRITAVIKEEESNKSIMKTIGLSYVDNEDLPRMLQKTRPSEINGSFGDIDWMICMKDASLYPVNYQTVENLRIMMSRCGNGFLLDGTQDDWIEEPVLMREEANRNDRLIWKFMLANQTGQLPAFSWDRCAGDIKLVHPIKKEKTV